MIRRRSRTPLRLVAAALLLCAACAGGVGEPVESADSAAGRQVVIDAHRQLIDALGSQDAEGVLALLDDDVLLFHPRTYDRFDDPEEIRGGLQAMFARTGDGAWSEVHVEAKLAGSVAWVTSHLVLEQQAAEQPFVGRATEIWVRRDGGWRLTHAHWSADPEF